MFLLILPLQLLGEQLLTAGPGLVLLLASHLVELPILIEAGLATVTNPHAPGTLVSLQGELETSGTDPAVSQHGQEGRLLLPKKLHIEILGLQVAGLLSAAGDDGPGHVGHLQHAGSGRHPGQPEVLGPDVTERLTEEKLSLPAPQVSLAANTDSLGGQSGAVVVNVPVSVLVQPH